MGIAQLYGAGTSDKDGVYPIPAWNNKVGFVIIIPLKDNNNRIFSTLPSGQDAGLGNLGSIIEASTRQTSPANLFALLNGRRR